MNNGIGILTGVLLVLILAVVVWVMRRRETAGRSFDERQLTLRARGTQLGFFVTLIAEAAVMFLIEMGLIPLPCATLAIFTAIMAGVVTFAVFCIRRDVFFRVGERGTYYLCLAAVIVVLDGITTGVRIAEGSFLTDGLPTFDSGSAAVMGVSFLVIFAAILARRLTGERDGE